MAAISPKLGIGLVTETDQGPWGSRISPKLGIGLVTEVSFSQPKRGVHHLGLGRGRRALS